MKKILSHCPWIIIDVGMIYFHREDEFKSLCREIILGAKTYERLCGSRDRYVVIHFLRGLYTDFFKKYVENMRIPIYEVPIQYFLSFFTRPLYLDPYAYDVFTSSDVWSHDVFIIGGIVDKPPRKRLTTELIERCCPETSRKKIVLKGSVVGVPPEINSITEIILKTLLYDDVEKAIKDTMSRRDAMIRAYYELVKRRRYIKTIDDVKNIYEELSRWLNLDEITFRRSLKRAGIPRELWI